MRNFSSLLVCFITIAMISSGCGSASVQADAAVEPDRNLAFSDQSFDQPFDRSFDKELPDGTTPDRPADDLNSFDAPDPEDGSADFSDGPVNPDGSPADLPVDGPPLPNGTCTQAASLNLGAGAVTVSGSTATYPNEYGTSIDCGLSIGTPIPLLGPQAYYRVQLLGDQPYRISVANAYPFPRVYLFTSCGATTINTQCASGIDGTISGEGASVVFIPPANGLYYIAVDSMSTKNAGSFDLTVEKFTLPPGATCQTARLLSLPSGTITVTVNTADSVNEFGSSIDCGYGAPFVGPQMYFKTTLTGGANYTFDVSAAFGGMMYIFEAQCADTNAINAACALGGSGFSAFFLPGGGPANFSPQQPGDYIIALDTFALPFSGQLVLTVTKN